MLVGVRNLNVRIDKKSWVTTPVPAGIAALDGILWAADMDQALLHIGLWTRPPTCHGFDLGDFWAWLRYGRALDGKAPLKLAGAWEDIDAHQKTLLSDDFGIGLGALLLTQKLGMQFLGETRHVVEVLKPGHFRLHKPAKRGPAKSPDYVVTDATGACHAVEFKGTQTTTAALGKAIDTGVAQKANLKAVVGHSLGYSIVMGVFVPQAFSSEPALVQIRDPTVGDLLAGVPPETIRAAILQITLARFFALVGLPDHAMLLASTSAEVLKQSTGKEFASREFDLLCRKPPCRLSPVGTCPPGSARL